MGGVLKQENAARLFASIQIFGDRQAGCQDSLEKAYLRGAELATIAAQLPSGAAQTVWPNLDNISDTYTTKAERVVYNALICRAQTAALELEDVNFD